MGNSLYSVGGHIPSLEGPGLPAVPVLGGGPGRHQVAWQHTQARTLLVLLGEFVLSVYIVSPFLLKVNE